MATSTTRLALRKPELTDQVNVETDLSNNYDVLDSAVGAFLCTSVTRPATPFQGQVIFETDTAKSFVRSAAAWLPIYVPIPPPLGSSVALTDAANIAVDAALGNQFRVTLGGNRTLGAPTNPTNGQKILIEVIQDATGSRTLAYNAVFGFGTDIPSPTLTTTANKRDFLGFVYNSTSVKWYLIGLSRGY